MKKQLKCYIYTRVSTSMQVDGYSLDAQKDKLHKYADYQDMIIAGEYSDEGKSGKSVEGRPQFQQMLGDIETGKDNIDFVLVFKLSRFGRNAADVLSSLQRMQDFGVNLICMEDGIDSSKDAGKLMISVLSAVAEIERENILVQTMEGRKQKAREGKWNGGFAPYGYQLINGELHIAEDEAEVIRIIYDKYANTTMGIASIATFLNNSGYKKKLRQNNTIEGFSTSFVKGVLDNPVYCGKLAFGRRKNEKIPGTRNEYHVVKQDNYMLNDGIHEAIVSEELWNQVHKKRQETGVANIKTHSLDHEHILSGIIKCPICGSGMYGNVNRKKHPDGGYYRDYFYYACKHRTYVNGHKCTYRKQWNEDKINAAVEEVIRKLVNNPKFKTEIQKHIGNSIDTNELDREYEGLQERLKQVTGAKNKLANQMDNLSVSDKHYDKKYEDMQVRLDKLYDEIEKIETSIEAVETRLYNIKQEKISGDNVYQFLLFFDKLYDRFTDMEKKTFMKSFLEEVNIYEAEQEDGRILRRLKFRFPVFFNDQELYELDWDNESTVEECCVPNNTKVMGSGMFKGCIELKKVKIPDGVTEIGGMAFQDCKNLEMISLTSGVEKTEEIVLSSGIEKIGFNVFENCEKIKKITIPQKVTRIESGTFSGCISLTNVKILSGVTVVSSRAFRGCVSISHLELPAGVTTIGDYIFEDCENLKDIVMSSELKWIGDGAFKGCKKIQKLQLSSNVKNIGKEAFYDCVALEEINIPDGVTKILDKTFYQCMSLTEIKLPAGVQTMGQFVFFGCENLKKVVLPEHVNAIENCTFTNCTSLTDIELPDGIWSIGIAAFSGCCSIEKLNLPNSVHYIEEFAFDGCESLKEIEIPESVEEIKRYTFTNCSSLEKAIIPTTVKHIRARAFEKCSSLKEVHIPEGVSKIESGTFLGCINLKTVYIPSTVTSIDELAFAICVSMEHLEFPEGLQEIGEKAFMGCEKLTEINLPCDIGKDALQNCTSLKTITLSKNVETISNLWFFYFENLEAIYVTEDNNNYASEDGVLFNKDKSILYYYPINKMEKEYKVPESVKKIMNAFYYVNELEKLEISDNVTELENYAILATKNLTIYGKTGSQIEDYAKKHQLTFFRTDVEYGDLNCDGKVDSVDSVLLMKYLAGVDDLQISMKAADVNMDDAVDTADAVLLQKYLAGANIKFGLIKYS